MKKNYFLVLLLVTSLVSAQSNITFNLTHTPGETMYVKGSFNGWSNDNQLTETLPGEYSVTLPIPDGVIEYKFANADWSVQDSFSQGAVCTITNYGNTNRYLDINGDQTLPAVALSACASSGGSYNVTFNVDMSSYALSTLGTVYINGENWNMQGLGAWCGACTPMTDMGGGIWSVTLPLEEFSYQFKFTVDGWSYQEGFAPGDPGTATDGTYTNRYIAVDSDKTINATWNTPEVLSTVDLEVATFSVYPNPSQNVWNIKTSNTTINSIQVFDVLGKQVVSLNPSSTEVQINASSFKTGLYLARIATNSGIKTIKLIKN